jgi:hypothetical protein
LKPSLEVVENCNGSMYYKYSEGLKYMRKPLFLSSFASAWCFGSRASQWLGFCAERPKASVHTAFFPGFVDSKKKWSLPCGDYGKTKQLCLLQPLVYAPRTPHPTRPTRAPHTTHHAPRTTHHAPRTTHHAPRTTRTPSFPFPFRTIYMP